VNSSHRPPPALLGRRNGFSRGHVNEIQRARLLAAAAEAVEEIGYARMTVSEIISRAGVSRKTFYDTFRNREDCFLALLEQSLVDAAANAGKAYLDEPHWRAGIRAALFGLLVRMEREPGLARLWIVESLRSGERVLARRAQVLGELARLIGDAGNGAAPNAGRPAIVSEGVVGGAVAILHTRLLSAPGQPLTPLLGPLMYMITLPYGGARVARRELTIPVPEVAPNATDGQLGGGDPLDGLDIRLTYRTVRVLVAIGQQPGASNREIADAAGIADQGQISKLLSRLAKLELIENHGLGQAQGRSNAWLLTGRGAGVVRATRSNAYGLA